LRGCHFGAMDGVVKDDELLFIVYNIVYI
jgi:hypothetical protein